MTQVMQIIPFIAAQVKIPALMDKPQQFFNDSVGDRAELFQIFYAVRGKILGIPRPVFSPDTAVGMNKIPEEIQNLL